MSPVPLPTRAELVEQLVRLVDIRLLDPLEILLADAPVLDTARDQVRTRAGEWADAMLTGTEPEALHTVLRLVASLYPSDRGFEPPLAWWGTPMGRVVALRVGHPTAESVSYPMAGAMLGITRQGVHDLLARGKLSRHPSGGVVPSSIRDRLRDQSRIG